MLTEQLPQDIFAYLLIFTRIGAALMVMPGFGETFVSTRIRLIFALLLSLILVPLVAGSMPDLPAQPVALIPLIAMEALIGIFLGVMVRCITTAMHIAGTAIATQSGFANAMMFDLTMSGQTTAITNLLTFTATVIIFSMNLHHVMLMGLISSYQVFTVGAPLALGDMANSLSSTINRAFLIALQLSSPFIVAGIILNLGGGILSRLMPNLQIFFILMAPQIALALFVLMTTTASVMLMYGNYVESSLNVWPASVAQ